MRSTPNTFKWLEAPQTWGLWCPPGGIPIYIRKADASILIRWDGCTIRAKAANVDQAKRYVLRWAEARSKGPWGRGKGGGFDRRDRMPEVVRAAQADWEAENADEIREFKPGELNELLQQQRNARRRP
ncbi:hypothetical protein [Xanthomonas axonopodis]|uniref:hypothetical protein n=1 Tax=Xanthomonas axonopodis TaxID=53413 RepID=UPI001116B588|nr:hypothetical protein [Xanthomonas axonopodis]